MLVFRVKKYFYQQYSRLTEKENVISAKTHAYNTDNNPYEGFEIHGDIDKVFLRGNLAVDEGKLVQEKLGTYIKRGLRQPLA